MPALAISASVGVACAIAFLATGGGALGAVLIYGTVGVAGMLIVELVS